MAYWYHQGTITVTQDSTTVSGTGTAFVENLRVGDGLLAPDGRLYLIQNIASDTELAIARGYVGETAADSGGWWGVPVQGYNRDLADRVQNLVTEAGEALEVVGQAKEFRDEAEGFAQTSQDAVTTSGQNAQATGEDRAAVEQSVQQVQGLVENAEELRDETSDLRGQTEQLATGAGQSAQAAGEARDQAQQIAEGMTALPEVTGADAGKALVVNPSGDGFELAGLSGKMIGEPFPLWDNLTGVNGPDNSGAEKYIRLTAGQTGSGQYNNGLLTSESVSGTAPLTIATAQIATGPLTGRTIHLINTEEAFVRARATSGSLQQDQMQRITGAMDRTGSYGVFAGTGGDATGVFSRTDKGAGPSINAANTTFDMTFDSADSPGSRVSASTSGETRSKNVSATWYMRIQ